MDRRTLLAFLLLTLLLVAYQVVFPPSPPSPKAPPPAVQESREPERSPERPAPATPDLLASEAMDPSGDEFPREPEGTEDLRSLPIDGEMVNAELDPRGARITRWELATYTDAQERPANLVPDAASALVEYAIVLDGREIPLSDIWFTTTRSQVDGAEVVLFESRTGSGRRIALEYWFPPAGYSTRVKATLQGFDPGSGSGRFEIRFPAGIADLERDHKVDQQGAAGIALMGRSLIKHGRGRGPWSQMENGVVQWGGVRSKYFLAAAIPDGAPDGEIAMSRGQNGRIAATVRLPLSLERTSLYEFTLFGGPMRHGVLESYGVGLERAVDSGWRVFVPLVDLLRKFFVFMYGLLPNYGIVIIILSILSRVVFYPLTRKSMESMKQMQLLKPEMDRLNEKYKNDPQKRNQAILELYKKNKVNPAGGCLPILVQMPVFIALYNLLNSAIELRKAPFGLWIQDLSAPDRVGSIAGFPIHILPLVMAATMLWQQKLTPTDPRQATLMYIMPIVMTIFFYPMPSGLVLYWTVSNLAAIAQQLMMNRSAERRPAVA